LSFKSRLPSATFLVKKFDQKKSDIGEIIGMFQISQKLVDCTCLPSAQAGVKREE
jgi:hypothetical protein